MPRQQRPFRLENQREAVVAVGRRKGTVDRDRLAAPLQRRLALLDFHRHVAVDDDSLRWIHVELRQHALAKLPVVKHVKIGILGLDVRSGVVHQVVLQRGNPVLAEQRRQRSAPEIPQQITLFVRGSLEGADENPVEGIEELPAAIRLAVDD